jgi:glycosyltransferase involved in cell wall biosynthesis
MRILKVTQIYYPYLEKGGPAVKVRALAEHLARRGHEVTVLTAQLRPFDQEQEDKANVLYLRTVAKYRTMTINRGLLPFCRQRLRTFDVVHIYGLYDLLGPVVAWFCRQWEIPYVVEPMGMYRPIVRSLGKKHLYHRLLGRALVEGAAALIATSEQERRELIEEGIASERVMVRRNGLNLSEFDGLPSRQVFRQELGLSDKEPLVLYLGRISHKKGLDLLLRAFAKLPTTARLAVIGPDDQDGCVQELERLRAQLGLEERVVLAGPRFGAQKLEALVGADLFVLPSQNENFGNAAAEAIACGVPVLVTDRCGIAPLVNGRAGLVVSYNEQSVREGLARLLEDGAARERLRAGCADVARQLSWEEPVARMEALYQQIRRKKA